MDRRVLVDPRADSDLDAQFEHIARNNRDAALRFLVWRVRGFKNHLIFYRLIQDGIEVLRVLHGARNIAGLFESEPD